MKTIKRLGVWLGIGLLLAAGAYVCIVAGLGTIIGLWDIPETLNWRSKTSPLDPLVVQDICAKFVLAESDRRCQQGAVVYAPEFFEDIARAFREHDGVWSTYEQVQQKLGAYQYRLEPVTRQADGLAYFVAGYDLRGDRVFPIGMFFYEDGRLFRISAKTTD